MELSRQQKLSREEQAALVARYRECNEEAFNELYEALRAAVEGYIRARTAKQEDAEDIAQDTWTKFHTLAKVGGYNPKLGSVLTFLKVIAASCISDYYRDRWHQRVVPITEDADGNPLPIWDVIAGITPSHFYGGSKQINLVLEDVTLRLTFGGSAAPHQLIVFGFNKRLSWTPEEIEGRYWEKPPLGESNPQSPTRENEQRRLAAILEDEYIATSELDPHKIRLRFKPLRDNMLRLVGDVVTQSKTREMCTAFLDWRTGDTILCQYHLDDPKESVKEKLDRRRAAIAEWIWTVVRRAAADALH
jgi:RNA polymerase sigma factor (sigma-70 family)